MDQGGNIYNEIIQRLTKIEVKLDNVEGIKKDVDQTKLDINSLKIKDEEQQNMIEELKDKNQWMTRTIIAGLITAAIGIIVCYIKIGLGI